MLPADVGSIAFHRRELVTVVVRFIEKWFKTASLGSSRIPLRFIQAVLSIVAPAAAGFSEIKFQFFREWMLSFPREIWACEFTNKE